MKENILNFIKKRNTNFENLVSLCGLRESELTTIFAHGQNVFNVNAKLITLTSVVTPQISISTSLSQSLQ